jgi:putative IMPACT (imprinted ancient) family translation regulator
MKLQKQGFYEVKKSKFYAYLSELSNFEEYKDVIEEIQKKHKKANHHCYAIIFNDEIKITNDGEVGSPGRILLEYLQRNSLTHHMLIVSRIFGGTKLGVGGVSRAFRKSIENLK